MIPLFFFENFNGKKCFVHFNGQKFVVAVTRKEIWEEGQKASLIFGASESERGRERENSNQVKLWLWCYGVVKMDPIWFIIIITSWFRYFNLLVHDGMMREIIRSVEYEFEKLWMRREKKNEKKRRNERKRKKYWKKKRRNDLNDEKSIKRVWAWKKIEQNFYDSWKNVRHSFLFRQKRVKKKVCACENDMTF